MEGLESSGDAILSEENGYSEAAVHHSDGNAKHSMVNGLSNGYDKEKKEKEKHKDKHHEKDRDKEKHRDKDGDRDKHRSKDGEKDKHKEKHKDRDREKDKHRDKEKERDKDKERDKERDESKHSSSSSSSKDKHSSSSSSKDKDKERKDKEKSKHHDDKDRKDKEHKSSSSSSKDKEHKSSSSSKHSSSSSKPTSSSSSKDKEHKDKEHRDKDKEREKEKDKERDREKDKEREREKSRDKVKDKERSKEKQSSSSSKDKERHSSDKHRTDKDKHSSSKEKERHSSDKKDKHKEKDRDKEKSKVKEKEKEKQTEKEIKIESQEIKQEIKEEKNDDFVFQSSIKEESLDDDDDGKLMIKEEATDDESKLDCTESSIDTSALKTEPKEEEEEDEDDVPMAARMAKMKRMLESEDEDDVPLMARKKPKKESTKKRKKVESDYDDEEDFKPVKKKQVKKEKKSQPTKVKQETVNESPKKKKKKEEEEQEVWRWWEEEKKPDGVKWNFLEHKGPVFAAPYEPLPPNVKFYYNDKEMKLSPLTEEVATFYARMLDHDYTTKEAFNTNFMTDWRKVMTKEERGIIEDLRKCNFKHMHAYFIKKSEERKAMSKEEKKAIKEENEKLLKEYGFCLIDGHKEKIGNFKIEPPSLFRGRGEHPKMGKLKLRVEAEDIIINCSQDSKVPPPPPGHNWKEVRHDNAVTWLASWTENVQGQVKYIMLNPSSKLKGEKDWQKYETARKLAKSIDKIRQDYIADWKSKEMRIRQRAVAMYFIDKLALRAGNEKDEDQADTVGCCSLRVEHIQLHENKDGKENVVVFDFLGKDSIRYYNEVPVEKRVFKNLTLFMENKKGEDDLFDRLNTGVLNKHLSDLMEGLTAKVFRTYNASWTLQAQLKELTDPNSSVAEKILSYNRANRAVAILCNHQRAVPKTHDKSMANLREKLANKRQLVEDAENNYKHAKRDAKNGSAKEKIAADKAKKTLERLKEQLLKLELTETDKEENKTIALGTSKLNYLDPRISVAWCKKFDVPIDKIYNKTQRDKFRWAIDMATADYVF